MKGHSIDEDWEWLVCHHADGSFVIVGVKYPNGDQLMMTDMSEHQRRAYLKRGGLKMKRVPS